MGKRKVHKFTREEEELLTKEFKYRSTQEMANELGLTYEEIANKAKRMGLKKTHAYLQFCGHRFTGMEGVKYRYKKGSIAHNKGKKMDPEVYEKVKSTFFKKGNIPHNTKYDGYERINKEGYREKRISKGKFKMVHRMVWEEQHGEIAKDMVVVFKDYDKLNCELDNLMLITHAENMIRNSITRYPSEIKELISLQSRITRLINKKENGKKQNV